VHDRENAFISYVAGHWMFTCWRYAVRYGNLKQNYHPQPYHCTAP
jgi:hypothetical protein